MPKLGKEKFNIGVSVSLKDRERIDSFCKKNGMSRSAFLMKAANDYMVAQEAIPEFKRLLGALADVTSQYFEGDISKEDARAKVSKINYRYNEVKDSLGSIK